MITITKLILLETWLKLETWLDLTWTLTTSVVLQNFQQKNIENVLGIINFILESL